MHELWNVVCGGLQEYNITYGELGIHAYSHSQKIVKLYVPGVRVDRFCDFLKLCHVEDSGNINFITIFKSIT